MRARPALEARLNLIVALYAERQNMTATLAIDDVVRAGLESLGLTAAVEVAEKTQISPDSEQSKRELDALTKDLRPLIAGLPLEGIQMMAS